MEDKVYTFRFNILMKITIKTGINRDLSWIFTDCIFWSYLLRVVADLCVEYLLFII